MNVGGRTAEDPDDVIANLRLALETRDVIGQAKGILMERHGITADQAFAQLATMSQRSNVKLNEVAAYLVELRTSGAPTPTDRPRPAPQPGG